MNNQITTTSSEASQKEQNQIILYRPNDTISLEVRLENETVWLTQAQIAELFDVNRTSIVKHIKNIYTTKELEENSTCAIFSQVRLEGNRKLFAFSKLNIEPKCDFAKEGCNPRCGLVCWRMRFRTHEPCVPTDCGYFFSSVNNTSTGSRTALRQAQGPNCR